MEISPKMHLKIRSNVYFSMLEWNENLCVVMSGNHTLVRVQEKGSQADTCGEKINARKSKVEQKTELNNSMEDIKGITYEHGG